MITKFLLLFIIWVGLTNSLHPQELLLGAVLSAGVVALFTQKSQTPSLFEALLKYLRFAPYFLKDLLLSNIQVARIVLNPKLPINPAIIKIETVLESEHDRLLLANAITLTPGTLTLKLRENELYIHMLNYSESEAIKFTQKSIPVYEKLLLGE